MAASASGDTPRTDHDGAEDTDEDVEAAEPVITLPFAVDPLYALAARPFGVTPGNAMVELHHDRFVARFGPWRVETPLSNIVSAEVTGPYSWFKVIGPAHLSVLDRGLTFATTNRKGVCLTFREPVRGIDPLGLVRHPGLTVTVAEPHVLAELVDRAGHGHHERRHDDVTVENLAAAADDELLSLSAAELRERARERGLTGVSSMSKAELMDALAVNLDDTTDDDSADDDSTSTS
jgi:hypothetical protein